MTKVVPPFDTHENLGYGTVKAVEERGGSWFIQVATPVLSLSQFYNGLVWAAGERPTHGNSEIVRVVENLPITGGRELKILRKQEGSVERSIKVGDQFMCAITVKSLTDIQNAVEASPATTGTVYVTTEGSATNDGSGWPKAKPGTAKGIMEAIAQLPVGPEGGRMGKVEIGAGVIPCNSSARYEAVATKVGEVGSGSTNSGPIIEVNSATSADIGAYVVGGPGTKGEACTGVQEGNHITAVFTGTWNNTTKEVELVGTKKYIEIWGGRVTSKEAGKGGSASSSLKSLWIVKPAIELPVGVTLVGRGRMGGYNASGPGTPGTLNLSIDYPTVLEDNGNGITIQVESGIGEKPEETLAGGGVLRDLVVAGNPENLFGFAVSGNFATEFSRVSFIGHGYWGARIGNRAVVEMGLYETEFRENGLHGTVSPNTSLLERVSMRAWQSSGGPQEYGKKAASQKVKCKLNGTTKLSNIESYIVVEPGRTEVSGTGITAGTIITSASKAEETAKELTISLAAKEAAVEHELTFTRPAKFVNKYKVGERVEEGGNIYEALKESGTGAGGPKKPVDNVGTGYWRLVGLPVMECGGLSLTKAPNKAVLYNVRVLGNFGVGCEAFAANWYGGECSKTSAINGIGAVGAEWGGVGMVSNGTTASGSACISALWCEHNENYAIEGSGAFYSCIFQGHTTEINAVLLTAPGEGPLTWIDCKSFNHTSGTSIKQVNSEHVLIMTSGTGGGNPDLRAIETNTKAVTTWPELESKVLEKF